MVSALKSEISNLKSAKRPATGPDSPAEQVNWADFRDHLTTADKEGRRQWLYPRKVNGRFFRARTWVSWLLLALMFTGPFVWIHRNPLLLFNIVERKFVILGQVFWPQDMIMFALALLIFITSILVFTAAYGRLWCGWTCPQTVLMEMVFRKIEYLIEGDSHQQRALAKAAWTAGKLAKKLGKHGLFFGLSFLIGNTLLAYLIGAEQLFKLVTDPPSRHIEGLTFMVLFTLVFYAIFARFREQACTFICPYGRFQSTLLDENTIVVAYDYKRGEKRRPRQRAVSLAQRQAGGYGDCIACQQCVAVCPTGIDIRNGTQMECVHCTACIDACDQVMARVGRPPGLIRYASLNGIERGEPLKLTPRLIGYTALLVALAGLLAFLVFTRSDVQTILLRAQGALFQKMPDGHFSNLYTVRVVNKTSRAIPLQFKLESPAGDLQVLGGDIAVGPGNHIETSLLVDLDPKVMKSGTTPLIVGVYADGRKIENLKTAFIGPRND
jgi:cytochrome c oxidase accessory protein FixG